MLDKVETMSIKDNLRSVEARIKDAALRGGHDHAKVQLLGVTKYASDQEVQELIDAGLTTFGENRIQDVGPRMELFPEVTWHFIGSLQSNKVRYCENFSLIHSLDRWSLARALNTRAKSWDKLQDVLVQVNVSGEESKSGLTPVDCKSFIAKVLTECPNLNIRGLMTMAPFIEAEATRPYFRQMKNLYEDLQAEFDLTWDILSMGMTNDFEIAVEEGATLVRIGSALFAKEDGDE